MVGGGGLVVSPIQLLGTPQHFKVIGQPNGVTTIELSTPHSKDNLNLHSGEQIQSDRPKLQSFVNLFKSHFKS